MSSLTSTPAHGSGSYPQYGWDFPEEIPEKIPERPCKRSLTLQSLLFWKKQGFFPKKSKGFSLRRTPKILGGKEKKNAQKSKENRKKQKKNGKSKEIAEKSKEKGGSGLSELFLEFPSRVRLGSRKPYISRHLKPPDSRASPELSPPQYVRLGTPLFSEVVPERASQRRTSPKPQRGPR